MGRIPSLPFYTKSASVCSMDDLATIDSDTTHITVNNNCGNNNALSVLSLNRFSHVTEVTIGDNCFMYVDQLSLVGLSKLRKVVIGMNSFTKSKNGFGNDSNRHFYVKNCPQLRELRIGRYSFSDYTVIEIENVDALEVVRVGDVGYESTSFYWASLELKSVLIHKA